MIIKRCLFKFGLCLTLLLFSGHVGAAENSGVTFDAGSQKAIQNSVIDQQIRIMPQLNALSFGLGWSGNHSFNYEKSLSKIFFQDHIVYAKIRGIDFDASNILLKLFHPQYGFGNITFVFNENLIAQTSDAAIQGILLDTLGDSNHRYVFGNPDSQRYHLFSCLHAEENSRLIRMSKTEAENQGYRPGGFCFKKVVYLPDLAIEIEIEKHWLARLREHALFMGDLPKQDVLNRLGRRVLENWPSQLLGYNYSFHLIYSQRMITMSTPTGKIFFSTALMNALENEREIEALLARAIAHVENRHSLKRYYSKTKAVENEKFLQTLTAAAGSFAGIFAGPASGAIKALGNLPLQGSSKEDPLGFGYEIDLEKEADRMAALYFDRQQMDRRHLSTAIKKLQIAALYFNPEHREGVDSNEVMINFDINKMTKQLLPGVEDQKKNTRIDDRAKRAQDLKFISFNEDNSFVFQKVHRSPVQLDLKYQSIIHDENKVLVYISDMSFLRNRADSNNRGQVTLYVTDKHGKHRFKLLEKYITEDMWGARLIFEAPRKRRGRFLKGIQDLEIVVIERQGPTDKGSDQNIKNFQFVKFQLDSDNRIAVRSQSNS